MSINALAPLRERRRNPLRSLEEYGQSVWLDYIRRSLITSGELQRLVDEDGLSGVTSNPAIFEKAITSSGDYATAIADLAEQGHLDAKAIFEELAILDVQAAANVLRQVYYHTHYRDGYVSLEVAPSLAHDTSGTIVEARRLWQRLSRPNVMIKVPATREGIDAIRALTAEGINVNATLLFSILMYEHVANAYIEGLQEFARRGGDLTRVSSVASFFISRIDGVVDADLTARMQQSQNSEERLRLGRMRGRVAIANARLAYQRYLTIYESPRWRDLSRLGAQTQRLLWASTSTKNLEYRDVVYVEELIGADTITTIPPVTFDAFRDHGEARASLIDSLQAAALTLQELDALRISMAEIADQLLDDGVAAFRGAFEALLTSIERRRIAAATPELRA